MDAEGDWRCCAYYLKQHDVYDRHDCGCECVIEKTLFTSFLDRGVNIGKLKASANELPVG